MLLVSNCILNESFKNTKIVFLFNQGYFIRRLLLSLDKLAFSELTEVLERFRRYYKPPDDTTEAAANVIQEINLECGEW